MRPALNHFPFLLLNIALLVKAPRPGQSSEEPGREPGHEPLPPPPPPEAPQLDPSNLDSEHPPPTQPKPDPTEPHAADAPAHVAVPDHPTPNEKSESELKETLSQIADTIESLVEAFNQNASPTSTDHFLNRPLPASPTKTPPPQAPACLQASEAYTSCYSATPTPRFYSLLRADQASCLCYATISGSWYWQPSSFDGYMTSCNSYTQTQSISSSQAAVRAGISSGAGLCASAGDVRTTAVVVVSGNVTATATVAATSGAGSTVTAVTSSIPTPTASTGIAMGREKGMLVVILLGMAMFGFLV